MATTLASDAPVITEHPQETEAIAATSGITEGKYGCYNYQPSLGFGAYWGELDITGPGTYEHAGVGTGTYELSSSDVSFTGDLDVYRGEYPVNGDDIDLIGIGDMDGVYARCSIPEG